MRTFAPINKCKNDIKKENPPCTLPADGGGRPGAAALGDAETDIIHQSDTAYTFGQPSDIKYGVECHLRYICLQMQVFLIYMEMVVLMARLDL